MFSVGYREPTTACKAEDFRRFLSDFCHHLDRMVDDYAKNHRAVYTEYHRNGYGRLASDCPDIESVSYGFSVIISMLWTIADEIVEAEERLEYSEDGEDSEEYQHTMGELFGAKTMFIALLKRFPWLEKERIRATGEGVSQRAFLRNVAYGKGDSRIATLDAGNIAGGTLIAKNLSANQIKFLPQPLTTNKTHAFKL